MQQRSFNFMRLKTYWMLLIYSALQDSPILPENSYIVQDITTEMKTLACWIFF